MVRIVGRLIIGLMTGVAGRGCTRVSGLMATDAGESQMLALKREAGGGMVKDGRVPGGR